MPRLMAPDSNDVWARYWRTSRTKKRTRIAIFEPLAQFRPRQRISQYDGHVGGFALGAVINLMATAGASGNLHFYHIHVSGTISLATFAGNA